MLGATVLIYGSASRGLWVLVGFGLVVVIVPGLALGFARRFWFGFFFEDLMRVLFGRRR